MNQWSLPLHKRTKSSELSDQTSNSQIVPDQQWDDNAAPLRMGDDGRWRVYIPADVGITGVHEPSTLIRDMSDLYNTVLPDREVWRLFSGTAWTSFTALCPPSGRPSIVSAWELNRTHLFVFREICIHGYDVAFGFGCYEFRDSAICNPGHSWPRRDILAELSASDLNEIQDPSRNVEMFATPVGHELIQRDGLEFGLVSGIRFTKPSGMSGKGLVVVVSQESVRDTFIDVETEETRHLLEDMIPVQWPLD